MRGNLLMARHRDPKPSGPSAKPSRPPGPTSLLTSAMIRPISKGPRLKLADAILTIADEDSRDMDVLKDAALQRMALDYRERSPTYDDGRARREVSAVVAEGRD